MAESKTYGRVIGVDVRTINEHLQNIYGSEELSRDATIRKIRIVQKEGNRDIARDVDFYNLDVIIAVGYRVNSFQATQFRIWATQTLREFIIKGFVLDDERLKQGKRFGKDYFDELLDRKTSHSPSTRMFEPNTKNFTIQELQNLDYQNVNGTGWILAC